MAVKQLVQQRSEAVMIFMAYLGMVSIGMFDGMLGVAWPSMRHTFDVSLDSLGLILAAGTIGFLLVSINSGRIVSRIGVGTFLLLAALLRAVSGLGFGLAPVWWSLLLISLIGSVGAGGVDTGLNIYFADQHSASRMNWLHACYSVGATLGPLLMTSLIEAELAWRWGYVITSILSGLVAIYLVFTGKQWQLRDDPGESDSASGPQVKVIDTLRIPIVWLIIAIFFMYTGTEVSAGQWAFTLFTESRHITIKVAGVLTSVYWGSLTVGRILAGFVADRVKPTTLLRISTIGVVVGTILIWWNPVNEVSFLGIALMGFSLAPIFPTMIATTPDRVGAKYAPHVIGFQFSAASLSVAALPGLAGVFAARLGLEIIGPFLFISSMMMLALHEIILLRLKIKAQT
jgi:fucose permease